MRMNLNFINSPHPLPPRWAWWLAKILPMSVKQSVNLMFIASSAAMAEKGMSATLMELVADARGVKEMVEWNKKPDISIKRQDNDHQKGDF